MLEQNLITETCVSVQSDSQSEGSAESRVPAYCVVNTPPPHINNRRAAVPADIIRIPLMFTHQLHFLLTPDGVALTYSHVPQGGI